MNFESLANRVHHLKWRHAAIILLAVFLAANWQVLSGRVYERWDAYDLGAPAYSLIADFIRAGHLLYWNPWIAGGSPDFAIPGSGVFSPDLLIYAAIAGPGTTAFLGYWLLVWVTGGIGMLLLARHFRAPVWGGLAVSLGFIFSGFYTGHAEHTGILYSYSLLPFIIWRLDVAITEKKILAAAQTGTLWGLSALAGYPALTICMVGLMVAWYVGRIFCVRFGEAIRDWKFGLLTLFAIALVGAIVLAPAYISAMHEGPGYSDRSAPLSREFALNSNAFHPGALATFSSPSFVILKQLQRDLWSYTDPSSMSIYTGGLTILLALLALTHGPERRWRRFLFVIALGAIGTAISRDLPLRGWLYDLLPITRYFQHGSLFRGFFLFLLSVLALFGAIDLEGWRQNPVIRRKLAVLAPLLAVIAALTFSIVLSIAKADQPYSALAYSHFAVVWGELILIALVMKRSPSPLASLPGLILLVAMTDGVVTCHLNQHIMFKAGMRPALASPASSSITPGPSGFRREFGTGSNLNLYSKVSAFSSYTPFSNKFQHAIATDPMLYTMALGGAEERVWFSAQAPEVASDQVAFDRFARRIAQLNAPVILRHSPEAVISGPATKPGEEETIEQAPSAINVPARILEYTSDRLVLDAIVPRDGWLMITDRWSRSWQAKVNGVTQAVSPANFIFRAVPVIQGANRIEFSFHPFALPALVILSWLAVGSVGVISLFGALRQRAAYSTCHPGGLLPNEPLRVPPLILIPQ